MLDKIEIGKTYELASGHKLKVLKILPPDKYYPRNEELYEVECTGVRQVYEGCLKRLNFKEQNNETNG